MILKSKENENKLLQEKLKVDQVNKEYQKLEEKFQKVKQDLED